MQEYAWLGGESDQLGIVPATLQINVTRMNQKQDSEIKTNHTMPTRRPDLVVIDKNKQTSGFRCLGDRRIKETKAKIFRNIWTLQES